MKNKTKLVSVFMLSFFSCVWLFATLWTVALQAPLSMGFSRQVKRLWCRQRLKAGGEGDDRGWDGWMASRTQWAWVWLNSGSWWWTRRPGILCLACGVTKSQAWLSDWTELKDTYFLLHFLGYKSRSYTPFHLTFSFSLGVERVLF